VLGGKIEAMLTHEGAAGNRCRSPPEGKKKIMHAKMSIDGEVLMASRRASRATSQPAAGFFRSRLQIQDPGDAERKFKALSEGGAVNMPFGKDVLGQGIRHVRRSVRHSLDGQLPDGRLRLHRQEG